ncbi:BCCT family transporter [Staphylococcus aureus]|nr:BCCT family transporter [Staphylococcus aureus]
MNSSSPENPNGKKYSPVFIYSAIVVAIVVLLGAFLPEQFNYVTNNIKMWITEKLGWYYLILTTIIVFFCIFLIFSPIGKLKLGKPNDKPEFNTISWFAMLFSAGMGIGLVFYGAAEPMAHFATPPTADPKTTEAYTEALRSTFFHWGFHAWAVYGVVALALAYSQFRKGEPGLLSRTLRPLLGDKVEGPIGIVLSLIALLLIASFFITSADSATFVLGMQTTFGSLNPSSMVKVVWGISQALIAFVLLLAGGGNGAEALNAIQSAAIISAFPFSFVVILMMVSFYKDANQERKFLGLTLTPNKHRLQEYIKSQQEDYESDILEKRQSRRNIEKKDN